MVTIPPRPAELIDPSFLFSFQAVFNVDKEAGLTLIEIAEDVAIEDIITSTGCDFNVSPDLKKMEQIS